MIYADESTSEDEQKSSCRIHTAGRWIPVTPILILARNKDGRKYRLLFWDIMQWNCMLQDGGCVMIDLPWLLLDGI